MKNKCKILVDKKMNATNTITGFLIISVLLIFLSAGGVAEPTITNIHLLPSNNPDTTDVINITWNTNNENSTSVIYYKLSNESSWITAPNSDFANLVLTHSVTIDPLAAGDYDYIISSCNETGNCTNSTIRSFTVSCLTPSITDSSQVLPSQTPYTNDTIIIKWNTTEDSTSVVYYKLNNESSWNTETGNPGTTHSVTIGVLTTGTYDYKVSSCNPACPAECTNSSIGHFTVSIPPCPAPSITGSPQVSPSNPGISDPITVRWNTSESSTSVVYYKLSNESSWNTETGNPGTTHSVTIGPLTTAGTYNYKVSSCNTECPANCTNSTTNNIIVSPPPAYNVSISSNSTIGTGKPNDVLRFTITVHNTGDAENFTLTVNSNCQGASFSLNPSVLTIPADAYGLADLQVTLPLLSCKANVTAASQTNSSINATVTINLNVTSAYGVDITAAIVNKTGGLGQNVTYTLTVKNVGNLVDYYNISASTTPSIPTNLSSKIVRCGNPDFCAKTEQEDITLTVTIPQTAVTGTTYTTNVTAKSNGNSSVKDSITITTIVGSGYNFNLSCVTSNCYNSGGAGGIVPYTLRLTNLGNINDTYSLTATTGAAIPNNVTVPAYSYRDFSLNFSIPAGTGQGTIFNILVTATSNCSDCSNKTKTINLTANTTGVSNGIITGFSAPANASLGDTISLNIIFKNTGSITVNATPKVLVKDSSENTLVTINGSSLSQNISSNSTYTFTLTWKVANLTRGQSYWLAPQVDYGGQTPATYTPSLLYILKPAELNITPSQVSMAIPPNVEKDVTISMTNTGDVGTINNINLLSPSDLNNLDIYDVSPTTVNTLNPGETRQVTLHIKSTAAGNGTGKIIVSYTNTSSQLSQVITFNITVISRPILDLNPSEIIYVNSSGSTSGKKTAIITNIGNLAAYNIAVGVKGLGSISMNVSYPRNYIYNITSGDNTMQLNYTISIPGNVLNGTHGKLEINYTDNITGGNKYNSSFDITIIVIKNITSMYVSPTSISISKPKNSIPVVQTITIINDGNQTLTNIQITSNITGVDIGGLPSTINSISSGETKTITAKVNIPSSIGTYSGNIIINATDNNLTKTISITVTTYVCGNGVCDAGESCSSCPQDCGTCPPPSSGGGGTPTHRLEIKKIDDYTAKLSSTVEIKITFENTGRRDENVTLFIDNCPSKWTCEKIKNIGIKKDKSVTQSLKITIPDTATLQKYKLTAKVDSSSSNAEDTRTFYLTVTSQCSKDSECKSGYCKNGICVGKKGVSESCAKSSECESGICSGGVCIECEFDANCDSGEYCSLGSCLKKKKVGETCNENYECGSDSCVNGTCIECESNKDCDSGEYCGNGICTALKNLGDSCKSNEECLTGRCKDDKCSCVSNSDCAGDEYCDNGECKKKVIEKLPLSIIITPENITVGDNVTIKVLSNGNPVVGAIVLVRDKNYMTDENGEVNFTANETGALNITVSKSGYTELSSEILVSEKKPTSSILWTILKLLLVLLIIFVIIIVILFLRKREKDKKLQGLRGIDESKKKAKDIVAPKEEVKEITKERGLEQAAEVGKGKEELKETPKRKIIEEEPELSIEDITLPSIDEMAKEKK